MRLRYTSLRIPAAVILAAMASLMPKASSGQQPTIQPGSFYLLRADGSIVMLPSTKAKMKAHGTNPLKAAAGVVHQKVVVDIPGQACAIRLRAGDPQTFLSGTSPGTTYMAPPDYQQLPETLTLGIYAVLQGLAVVKSEKRELVLDDTKANVFTAASGKITTSGAPALGIPLNFSRYAGLVVKSEPRVPLPPGEYAFVCSAATMAVGCVAPTTDLYAPPNLSWDEYQFACFGIDQ
jgi:hypothetical protein